MQERARIPLRPPADRLVEVAAKCLHEPASTYPVAYVPCRGYPFWICPAISDKGTLDTSVNENAAMRQ